MSCLATMEKFDSSFAAEKDGRVLFESIHNFTIFFGRGSLECAQQAADLIRLFAQNLQGKSSADKDLPAGCARLPWPQFGDRDAAQADSASLDTRNL
jgi:hypothetical protein